MSYFYRYLTDGQLNFRLYISSILYLHVVKLCDYRNLKRPKEEVNDPNSIYNENKKRINRADFQIKTIKSHFLNGNGQVDPHSSQSQIKGSTKSNGRVSVVTNFNKI